MTRLEQNSLYVLKGLFSAYRVVFAVVAATIISVIVETGIVRVSGFVDIIDTAANMKIFVGVAIFCVVSQLIILNFVRHQFGNFFRAINPLHIEVINKATVMIQLGIIVLIVSVLLEVGFTVSYHKALVMAVIVFSFLAAACMMALLAWRLTIWLRTNKNGLILTYLIASLVISISAIAGMMYLLDQLFYEPDVVHPKIYGEFIKHGQRGNLSFVYAYTISSAIAFVSLWIGTVILLRSYSKRLGTRKYWIIMSVPLLYFLSQFQPVILNFLLSYASENPMLFSIVYIVMVDVSRPIGGVLFGLTFIQIARKLQNQDVKGYLIISGIGFLLLLVSYQSQTLITAPFPPLGLLSSSYFGLSSYLIFIGIYSSAISTSQDSKLRASIRRSVETEISFIGTIGGAEMNNRILERVLTTSKNIAEKIPEETGISSSLTDEEIKQYANEVIVETLKKRSGNNP
jgi:hypothetical protein